MPLNADDDIRATLTRYAHERMEVVGSSTHVALARLIISESEHNPDSNAAQIYLNAGPRLRVLELTKYFTEQNRKGRMNIDDPAEAAAFFNSSLINPWYFELLLGFSKRPYKAKLRTHAARTIDRFLKLYLAAE